MEELRDKNGLTEAEFLAGYDMTKFDRPSLTADNLIFSFENGVSLLLIRRKGHPYLGRWALPGGFAERGESIEESAARELKEETSLTGLEVVPAGFFAYPGRDPRGWWRQGALSPTSRVTKAKSWRMTTRPTRAFSG